MTHSFPAVGSGQPEPGPDGATTDQEGPAADEAAEGRARQLAQEQQWVTSVYERLDGLRAHTRQRLAHVRRDTSGGTHQNRSERDAFATLYEDRLSQLNAVEDRLVFGRLDPHSGERQYIGRLGISDADHHPMLTDWRAPAARPFYQATAAHPGEVVLRRHLQTQGRRVVGLEDDLLDPEAVSSDVVLTGEGALLAALNAQRSGRMSDIVATIQAEQDAIIRSSLAGVLVVGGGPGTGKTAVALHRAAYLLYAHREAIARSGVLVVGPSPTFLRYIEQVLPALGETGVVSTTMAQLVPGIDAQGQESATVAEIKGRPIWARIIANAVKARQRILPEQTLRVGSARLQLRTADMQEARRRARRSHGGHNKARVAFVRHMLSALATQYLESIGGGAAEESDILADLRSAREVRVALNLCWMPLTPTGLLQDLYSKPHRLVEAAPRLSTADREALARNRSAAWTPADVPLLDEAAELLGDDDEAARAEREVQQARHDQEVAYAQEMLSASGAGGGLVSAETVARRFASGPSAATTAERAGADRSWTYGHVVVDEAQELSAMGWRALFRRNPRRSMTIVGDVWQTSSSAGASDWASMLQRPLRGDFRTASLTVNYRTPASIMRLAQHAMRSWNPNLPPAEVTSAREVADAVARLPVDDIGSGVTQIIERERATAPGTIAVITAPGQRRQMAQLLGLTGPVDLHNEVVVLDAAGSKGLEFDVVVLAEPEQILQEAPAADLYVAMTRATQRLYLVHAQRLPVELASAQ